MPDHKTYNQINLLDVLEFLVRRRRIILTTTIVVALAAAIFSFIVHPRYRSIAVIKPSEAQNSGLGGLIAAKLSSLGGISGFLPSLGEIPGELFITILKTRWMSEQLIEEFNLRKIYKLEKSKTEDVIKYLNTRTRFELEPESQTIVIYAEDEDAKRAQAMTQFLVDRLDRRNQELRSTNATREREYLGARLDETKTKLTMLEDSVTSFQLRYGILDPQEQVKATISAVAALEAQELATKIELDMNNQLFGQSNGALILQSKLASIRSVLEGISRSKDSSNKQWDLLLHMNDTPHQAIEFLRLKRDVEIQQLLMAILIQQYEQAKLDEKRNTPTLMRLDPPVVSAVRCWPKRGLMVGGAAFGAFIFVIALLLCIDFFKRASSDPHHAQFGRMARLKDSWKSGKAT